MFTREGLKVPENIYYELTYCKSCRNEVISENVSQLSVEMRTCAQQRKLQCRLAQLHIHVVETVLIWMSLPHLLQVCGTGRCGDGQLCGDSGREEVEQDMLPGQQRPCHLQVEHSLGMMILTCP